jgi:predicted PurR-regulated permease PerM
MLSQVLIEKAQSHLPSLGENLRKDLRPVVIILIALGVVIWFNRSFVKPMAMAALFAATLSPLDAMLRSRVPWAALRAGLLTALFAVTFIVPIGIVAFLSAEAGLKAFHDLPEDVFQMQTLDRWISSALSWASQFVSIDTDQVKRVLQQGLGAAGRSALGILRNLVTDLPKLTMDNAVIVVGLYVFLCEGDSLRQWVKRLLPMREEAGEDFLTHLQSLAKSVVLASVVAGLVQSLIFGLASAFVGQGHALLIMMTAFILSFIPVIGTAPVSIFLIGSNLIEAEYTTAIVFAAAAGLAGLSDNLIRPLVMSGAARIHPVVGFLAAFGGLEAIGFYGLFLGPVIVGGALYLIEISAPRRTSGGPASTSHA